MSKLKHDSGTAVLVVEFKEDLEIKHYSESTIKIYLENIIQFLLWMEKTLDKRVKEITREDITNYNIYLKQKGYSPNSIHRFINSVKRFFHWLEEKLYILINPCENLTIPKPKQPIPVVLTEKEVMKIINAPNTSTRLGIRDRAILETLYSTGIRLAELNNLTIFDIDTSSGFLRVNKGKFSKDRFAPLTKPACYWLNQYIKNVRPKLSKNKPKEQALFLGQQGRKIFRDMIIKLITRYAKAAGIKKRVTAHTFRHTIATHMLENDADIFKIQKLLGHKYATTTQRYTKVHPKQIKQTHKKYHPREADKNGE